MKMPTLKYIQSDAVISPCDKYRYVLRRTWDAQEASIGIVGLNPSTADANVDDATVLKCVKLAQHWGYGGIVLVNLFALRSTDKRQIKLRSDPVGPENDYEIRKALSTLNDVLVAWGNEGTYLDRSKAVQMLLVKLCKLTYCIKRNKGGEPAHPLYQADDSPQIRFLL